MTQEEVAANQVASKAFADNIIKNAAASGLTVEQLRISLGIVNQSLNSQKVSAPQSS